jgi:phage terminase large subunit
MKIQTTKIFSEIEGAVKAGFTTISLQGSARSSKTYNTLIWLIVFCLQKPGTRLSIVRATLPALKGSVYVDFIEIMRRMELYDAKRMNKTELTYHLDNGSWIEFFSADSEQKLRGRKRDVLFVNEANELGYAEWQQLKLRTTSLSIIDYNPSFSDEHWINYVNGEPKTYHFVSTYRDNPFLEQTIVDEIESLREKNPSLWQIYGLGQQAQVEGLIFTNVETVEAIPPYVRHRYGGVDFGYSNDPTAIVQIGIYQDVIFIDEIAYNTEMLTTDIIRTLKESELLHRRIISESADPRLIQEIYRAGLDIHPVKKYAGSIIAGINKMQEYTIKVTRRSTNVLKEFKNYTYRQDKDGHWRNEPIDIYNHAIDAIRYVIMSEVMGGKANKVDLARLQQLI